MGWTIVGIAVVAFAVFTWLMNKKWDRELKEVQKTRPKLTREEYINLLIQKGYKRENIEIAYDSIRENRGFTDFSMYPEDDIYELYRMDPEEFTFLVEDIFKKHNWELPPQNGIDILNQEFEEKFGERMTIEYFIKLLEIGEWRSLHKPQ